MKNPVIIVLTVLGALCAAVCIGLIIVIVLTGSNRSHSDTTDTPIAIPERFRELTDTAAPLPDDTLHTSAALPDKRSTPRYARSIACRTTVSPETLKTFLKQRDLFCSNSQWSKKWANPAGRGIRTQGDALGFGDSVVNDTLTHLMWQRYSTLPKVKYGDMDDAIESLNMSGWQGYRNWRPPTIEELLVLLTPAKNHHGLHLPDPWDCRESDFWSCNPAADTDSIKWIWVIRMGAGRCNYGHPDMVRSLLVVREY